MVNVDFCRAPSGLYIGWAVVNNGHYWASGRTLDLLNSHIKFCLRDRAGICYSSVMLASKPTQMQDVPVDLMSKQFRTLYWLGGAKSRLTEMEKLHYSHTGCRDLREIQKEDVDKAEPTDKVKEPEYDFYNYQRQGNKLVVWGCVKVAEYVVDDVDTKDTPLE